MVQAEAEAQQAASVDGAAGQADDEAAAASGQAGEAAAGLQQHTLPVVDGHEMAGVVTTEAMPQLGFSLAGAGAEQAQQVSMPAARRAHLCCRLLLFACA
jgi:hypothetical protein